MLAQIGRGIRFRSKYCRVYDQIQSMFDLSAEGRCRLSCRKESAHMDHHAFVDNGTDGCIFPSWTNAGYRGLWGAKKVWSKWCGLCSVKKSVQNLGASSDIGGDYSG